MAQQYKKALVYVKNSEIFYIEEKTATMVKLINQPYLEDLETIDTGVLTKSLNLWKEKNKGIHMQILIIFSDDVLFEKTFKNNDPEIEQKVDQFLDKVPFDHLVSRHYDRKDETDFVVISRELFEAIVDCFEKQGFTVINTLPEPVIKTLVKYSEFDGEASKKILAKYDFFKNPKLSLNNKSMMRIKKKYQGAAKNMTTLVMLGSFLGLLVIILVFILFMQSFYSKKVAENEQLVQTQIVLPTVADRNVDFKRILPVEISYSEGSSSSAQLLKKNLEANNYKNVTLTLSGISGSSPIVAFSNNLDNGIQNDILGQVETLTPSLLIKHIDRTDQIVKISL